MIVKELVAILPTPDALLRLTDRELQLVLLGFVCAVSDDPLRRMVTCAGIMTELFRSHGGYEPGKREPVRKAITRAWRSLEAAGLIEEPDPYNGKNGYRVVSEQGRQVNTDVDLAAATVRGWLKAETLDPRLHGACL